MTRHQLLGTLVALGAVTLNVSSAQAQSCNATSECPKNYLCSVVATTMTGCGTAGAGAATAVDTSGPVAVDAGVAAAGAPGSGGSTGAYKVPTSGGSMTQPQPIQTGGSTAITTCSQTTVQVKQCVPLACTSDAECAAGWSCQSNAVTTCSTTVSAGGAESGPAAGGSPTVAPSSAGSGNVPSNNPAVGGSPTMTPTASGGSPSECVTNTQSTCKPKALNPCEIAEDCGPGYDCVDNTACACSGSGGTVAEGSGGATSAGSAGSGAMGSGDAPIDSTTSNCVCGPSGTASCQAQTIDCQTRTDCPETWTCMTASETPVTNAGGGTSTSTSAGAATSTSTAVGSATSGNCLPPYDYFSGKSSYATNGGAQTAVDVSTSEANNGSATTGIGGNASNSNDSPGADSQEESSPTAATPATAPGSMQGGGCQISRGHESRFAAVLLGLLAAFGLRRRRQIA